MGSLHNVNLLAVGDTTYAYLLHRFFDSSARFFVRSGETPKVGQRGQNSKNFQEKTSGVSRMKNRRFLQHLKAAKTAAISRGRPQAITPRA